MVTEFEAPLELFRVTVTETTATPVTDWVAVASVKGTVRVNSVPNWFEVAVFAHQVLNGPCTGTEISLVTKVSPVAGAKAKDALIMSRVEEKPVMTTVTPPLAWVNVTLVMNGTPGALVMVCVVGEPS